MADTNTTVHIGENSPEQVAFKLLTYVADAEDKKLYAGPNGKAQTDRKWILDTYAKCLETVKNPHLRE